MSRNERLELQKEARQTRKSAPRPKLNTRARRTHERLGSALVELMQEKSVENVTLQEVLDRASVGRSTFYLHFRDKNDLLLSQFENFLEIMSTTLSTRREESQRVVPVTEMFEHIGASKTFYRMLADAGRLDDFFELAQGYFARGIERRLRECKPILNSPRQELAAHSFALAGSLLSLLKWWMDRGAIESPSEMDQLFHRIVWNGFQ